MDAAHFLVAAEEPLLSLTLGLSDLMLLMWGSFPFLLSAMTRPVCRGESVVIGCILNGGTFVD